MFTNILKMKKKAGNNQKNVIFYFGFYLTNLIIHFLFNSLKELKYVNVESFWIYLTFQNYCINFATSCEISNA